MTRKISQVSNAPKPITIEQCYIGELQRYNRVTLTTP
jgi:hypothetical protein